METPNKLGITSDLKDNKEGCKDMAESKDYCKAGGKHAEWMWKNCRKSCDYYYGTKTC